ncbi:MAG: hypothetical protein WAS51_14515 [Ilumatobacteraceae bacterium]
MLTLKYPVGAGSTVLEFNEPVTELCAKLAANANHVFLSLYNAAGNETVIATSCSGGKVTVIRGAEGTEAKAWNVDNCATEIKTEPGPVCENPDVDHDAQCCACLNGVDVSSSFTVERGNCSVRISLAATGVAPGEYCGARVNEFGQFTYIPDGWPYNCLPVFDPCGPCEGIDSGCSGDSDAAGVAYIPAAGSCVAIGTNLQTVVQQIDNALCGLMTPDAGVMQVTQGAGISISGTISNPVVSLSPTGIGPGIYDGFTVNQFGQIISYAVPPAPASIVVAGEGAISVDYSAGTKTYTVSIEPATTSICGCVQVADISEAMNFNPSATNAAEVGTKAATVEDVYQMIQQAGLEGVEFEICGLVELPAIGAATYFAVCDGDNKRISKEAARRDLGGVVARGHYSDTLVDLVEQVNVAAVSKPNAATVRVQLVNPGIPGSYHVSVTPLEGFVDYYVERISDAVFDVHFRLWDQPYSTGTAAAVDFTFTVTEI